jgi:hypothetical protein
MRLVGAFWSSAFYASDDGSVTRFDPAESSALVLRRGSQGFIYIISAEPPHHTVDTVTVGDRFRVGVLFNRDPGLAQIEVTLSVQDASPALVKPAHRVDSVTYMTDPISVDSTVEP